jgi:putative DNA primase/helicase
VSEQWWEDDAGYDEPVVTDADLDAPDFEAVADKLTGMADEAERLDYLRTIPARIVDLSAADIQRWRDLCAGHGLGRGDFKAILAEARRGAEEKEKARRQAEIRDAVARAEAQAVATGAMLPGPQQPLEVARALVMSWPRTDLTPHIAWWRGDFYRWVDTHWAPVNPSVIQQRLYEATGDALYRHPDPKVGIVPWAPNRRSIGDLEHALARGVVHRDPDLADERVIACVNGVLDLATRTLTGHHPVRFNLSSLPFAYSEGARCPHWLAFLADVLPGDEQAVMFLQEWFGYVISGRTDLQKIANLFGPRRSGKSTVARVLEAVLGAETVTSPKLQSLAGDFGEQPLIGKSLAVLTDISWNARDIVEAVEVLKAISGEDSRDVHRKNREAWHGKLGVRFMLIGNDMPKFKDASGALAGRMIHIQFTRSFFGQEDHGLTARLLTELPGILNWALDGLARLAERGRLLVPDSSRAIEGEILRQTSPVAGFLDDRAAYAADCDPLTLDDVYGAYRDWCIREDSRDHIATKEVFSRDLRSAGNGAIRVERKKLEGQPRRQLVYGLVAAYPGALTPPVTPSPSGWLIND